jgi:hypothetical protein
MKKILTILAFILATVAIKAQVTAYDSYINWPMGSAQKVILADTGINTFTAHNTVVYAVQDNLETAADTVKANMTINVTAGSNLKIGSILFVEIRTGVKASPYTVAFATGCVAITVTPTASKIQVFELMYNGGSGYRLINKYNCN